MSVIDNLEQIGHKASGSVTQIPSYDPDDRIGPVSDYARDFHSNERVVGINATPGIKEQLPPPMQDSSGSSPGDMLSPKSALGTPTDPAFMRESPANDFTTQQITVLPGGAQRIVQARSDRRSLVIMNLDPVQYVYIGNQSGVVQTSGFPVVPGAALPLNTAGEVWAVVNTAATIATIETMGSSD